MCLQMLVLKIRLVTAFVVAEKRPFVRMCFEMICKSDWTIERLSATFVCALQMLQFGGELLSCWRQGSSRGVNRSSVVRESVVILIVIIVFVRLSSELFTVVSKYFW